MNAEELRALQAPLKERYRAEPATAVVTLRAEGKLGEDLTCRVDTGRASSKRDFIPRRAVAAPRHAPVTCFSRRSLRVRV